MFVIYGTVEGWEVEVTTRHQWVVDNLRRCWPGVVWHCL